MDKKDSLILAERIIIGKKPRFEEYESIAALPLGDVFDILPGADLIREAGFGKEVHLCTICNAKSGRCSEDCAFCSQASIACTDAPIYPLIGKAEIQEGILQAKRSGMNRYSMVTSGKRITRREVNLLADAMGDVDIGRLGICCSLGILDRGDLSILRDAGMTRYHHNLETSASFFGNICTTHTYQERIDTIKAAKEVGLSTCVGGLFGMGETDAQVLELALAIKDLDVDSVPINFLSPIRGTRLGNLGGLKPLRCLKIIALFRYVLPDKDILICGGREENLRELHPLVFFAGASGIMTGNYLTTTGRKAGHDLRMIEDLGFSARNV